MKQGQAQWLKLFEEREQIVSTQNCSMAIEYLIHAQSPGEAWGAYPGLCNDLHSTALAIEALFLCGDTSALGQIANAVLFAREIDNRQLEHMDLERLVDLLKIVHSERQPDSVYVGKVASALLGGAESAGKKPEAPSVRVACSVILALSALRTSKAIPHGGKRGRHSLAKHLFPKNGNEGHAFGDRIDRLMQSWLERLLSLENTSEGSWPLIDREAGSVAATAWVVRALRRFDQEKAERALERGLQFLERKVSTGWETLDGSADTFTQALVLHALAEEPDTDYRYIEGGVDAIVARRNSEGGWGGKSGAPSNIECTAVCVLALIAAGENVAVPTRLAKAAVLEMQERANDTAKELAQLRDNFDKRVSIESGKIEAERNQLRAQLSERQSRLARVESEREALLDRIRTIERYRDVDALSSLSASGDRYRGELSPISVTRPSSIRTFGGLLASLASLPLQTTFVAATVLLTVAATILLTQVQFFQGESGRLLPIAVASIGIVIAGALAAIWSRSWRRDQRELLRELDARRYESILLRDLDISGLRPTSSAQPQLQRLRINFLEITASFPPSVREEIVYRFAGELSSLPDDVGRRYIADIAVRLGVPTLETRNLALWADDFLRLPPPERRVLVDQIRRAVL